MKKTIDIQEKIAVRAYYAWLNYYGGTHRNRYDLMDSMVLHVGAGDAASYHRYDGSSPASARTALVLSTVGCNWRDDEPRYAKRRA